MIILAAGEMFRIESTACRRITADSSRLGYVFASPPILELQ